MSYETVIWEVDEGVGRLTLNRPDSLNAWTTDFGEELKRVVTVDAADAAVRAGAGVRLLPVIDAQGSSTERQIMTGCLALLAVSLLPTLVGLAGGVYFAGALALGVGFATLGAWQAVVPSLGGARRVLYGSLLYLPALLALLAFDKA